LERSAADWGTPADMAAYVFTVNNAMDAANFFRQGGVESLRRLLWPHLRRESHVE